MCAYRSPPSQISVTTLPCSPRSSICAISCTTPHMAVPVEPPTLRPLISVVQRIAAIEAASGTRIIRSITVGLKDGSTWGRPMPSMREPRAVTPASPVANAS